MLRRRLGDKRVVCTGLAQAGWFRDRSQLDSAPLIFGVACLLTTAVLAVVLQNKLVRSA